MNSHSSLQGSVLDALPHPVFVIAPDGAFEFANAAAEDFFKSSFAVLKKRTLDWFMPDGNPMRTLVEQVQRTMSPVSEYKVDVSSPRTSTRMSPPMSPPAGEDRWVDVYVAPVAEQRDRVVVVLQVRSMADTLDRQFSHRGAARTVTGLASMLAHEIKNPLSGIRGAAQLLESSGGEDDKVLTRLITDETDRIVRLVDRMEVFSDERPVERDPVNIHAVLEHVKTVAGTGFAKGITILEHYDPSLPLVAANRDQLVQVFLNLVKNAQEALDGQKDGTITLSTAYRTGMKVAAPGSQDRISLPIALTVTDNGSGIPEDIRSYMFDPFISGKSNGSGLGLALVAKIIEDHGGAISCESQPGLTRFQVLMPAWKDVTKV